MQMKSSGILTELEQYHTAAHCSQVTGTKGTIPILPSYCCQAPHIRCSLAWQTQGRILGSQNSPHLFEQMPLGCDTFMWTKCRAQTAADTWEMATTKRRDGEHAGGGCDRQSQRGVPCFKVHFSFLTHHRFSLAFILVRVCRVFFYLCSTSAWPVHDTEPRRNTFVQRKAIGAVEDDEPSGCSVYLNALFYKLLLVSLNV